MKVWMQSKYGHAHDLVNPESNVIDFAEIADTLANINRYGGCGEGCQVSVALHTLAGMAACESELLPWWLLHDAHEAFITDITTPVAQALEAIGNEVMRPHAYNYGGGAIVKQALRLLKSRHDLAIHRAAGIPLPTAEQKDRLKAIDLIVMKTERRDFLKPAPEPWHDSVERAEVIPTEIAYMPPGIAGRALLREFWRHLPGSTVRRAA